MSLASGREPTTTALDAVATVAPIFVLLFAMTPDVAAARSTFPAGLSPMADEASQAYLDRMESLQRRLFGDSYSQASRLQRTAVGQLNMQGEPGDVTHAEIYLVIHKCGAAVWEVTLFAPRQPIDVARWIGWLDLDSRDSPARLIWDKLAGRDQSSTTMPEMYIPLAVLRFRTGPLQGLVENHAHDLVALLHRDSTGRVFKNRFVGAELRADLCRDEDGMWLLARNGAVDVHVNAINADESRLPHEALPLLLTLQVLCLDRAVMRAFLDRFAQKVVGSVDDLVQLRREIFENLEEYYGTLAKTHSYTSDALARGESLYGIDDLFKAVSDRLESLTFEITTRNQQSVNRLGLWLTTSFGAIETGFVAASIATWYYATNLLAVLGWTVGTTLATALAIATFLRRKVRP